MIDIHSHILFEVDDGSRSLDEAISHAKQALEAGYSGIVCSAHYKKGRFENEDYDENFKKLEEEIKAREINIKLYKGNELEINEDVFTCVEKAYSINDSKYVLLEFSENLVFEAYMKIFKKLMKKGYTPILAHIERYPHIKIEEFIKMYEKKIIFQMNIRTVMNMSKKTEILLKKGYINVVATDSHRLLRRDYNVEKYLKKLKDIVGEKRYLELTKINPEKIIKNEEVNFNSGGEKKKNEKILSFNGAVGFVFKRLFYGFNSGRSNWKG